MSRAADSSWKTYFDQGQTALSQSNPALAEQSFRKALSLTGGSATDSDASEKCMLSLANTLTLRNKTGEAQALYQKLLAVLIKKHGETKAIEPVLMSLGSIQESLGDHNRAVAYYQRAVRINEKDFGPYSPEFAHNLHSLARANARAGHTQAAKKQYKQAISILMKEPSLNASDQLEKAMHEYSDLMKGSDDSDRSLINDFKKDILDNPAPDNSSKTSPGPKPDSHSSINVRQSSSGVSSQPSSQIDRAAGAALPGHLD